MKYFALFLLLSTSTKAFSQSLVNRSDLDSLRTYLTGSFSSETQSKHDSSYRNIHFNVNTIWSHRIDGVWLYAEQALDTSLGKPYRQTVYHFFQINDTTIINQPYDVIKPSRVIGAWHNPKLFDRLHTDSLKLQVGCPVMLHKSFDGVYYGNTPGKRCSTDKSGAAYITTEIKIYPDRLLSWERGWDMYDKQVWGAANGDYIFIKEK